MNKESQVCENFVVSKQHWNLFPQGKSWRPKGWPLNNNNVVNYSTSTCKL